MSGHVSGSERDRSVEEWARQLIDRLGDDPSGDRALAYLLDLTLDDPLALDRLVDQDKPLLLHLLDLALHQRTVHEPEEVDGE